MEEFAGRSFCLVICDGFIDGVFDIDDELFAERRANSKNKDLGIEEDEDSTYYVEVILIPIIPEFSEYTDGDKVISPLEQFERATTGMYRTRRDEYIEWECIQDELVAFQRMLEDDYYSDVESQYEGSYGRGEDEVPYDGDYEEGYPLV